MVLEDLDFNHKSPWWCIEGGAQELAHSMRKEVEVAGKKSIAFEKTVTAMRFTNHCQNVSVNIKGEHSPRNYDAVFNSAPLGAMQRMDLSGLNLNWGTKQAIRSLGYGASCKVGIRFKTLWWKDPQVNLNINRGGVAKTDLPLRVCVYPSYNIHDKHDQPGVLLCSYTWSQEAQRVASLINRNSPENEDELRVLLIHNLAKLHAKTNDHKDYARLHAIISDAYETHYAYDWYADPSTAGAFAYFGPGQFHNMYPWIVRNHGKHIIIGEAASAHHAWVVGALESAVRGVYQFLFQHSKRSKAANDALMAYNQGTVRAPYGPLPYEFDRERDVDYMTAPDVCPVDHDHRQAEKAAEGMWAREQVIFEEIRLKQGGDQIAPEHIVENQLVDVVVAA